MVPSHPATLCAGRLRRPLRPARMPKRIEAFLAEVLHDAVADGLVELCPSKDGDGPGYRITPAGRDWLLEFPPTMLGCAPRARPAPPRPPPSPRRHGGPTSKSV